MFHAEHIRRPILRPATVLLFHTVISITEVMRPRSYQMPWRGDREHVAFLQRFGISNWVDAGPRLMEQISEALRAGVALESDLLPEALSADLVERIEQTIGNLFDLNDGKCEREVDRIPRFVQFWRAEGGKLMEAGIREPKLTEAFEEWRSRGGAEFTLPSLKTGNGRRSFWHGAVLRSPCVITAVSIRSSDR
jgi:hypothetical protein